MRIDIQREDLLKPLQAIIGVVERRQTLPVLANVRLELGEGLARLTATDLEVELVASIPCQVEETGEITLPARKLLDICRNLPDQSRLQLQVDGERASLRAGRSRFTLATLPADDYPSVEDIGGRETVRLPQGELRKLIERTHFSMAVQDVRYYLNGLMVELEPAMARMVATDGHRLALAEKGIETGVDAPRQVIVPRKGVQELLRLLGDSDEGADLELGENHIRVRLGDVRFTSKLIDGRFPDYRRVVPEPTETPAVVNREDLRHALLRVSILSNEKYRGVRFLLEGGVLKVASHNPEQEEAEEEVSVDYAGEALEVGFNAGYVLDALGALEDEDVKLTLRDSASSGLIQGVDDQTSRYVVMPMRL